MDDGSLDDSPRICDEYAEQDPRVRVFHKKNGGVSDARNYGIDKANGTFLFFADNDDYVFPDFIETMVSQIESFDLLVSGYLQADENKPITDVSRLSRVNKHVEAHNISEIRKKIKDLDINWLATIWNCLFRKSIIDKAHIRFHKISSEDELFVNEYLLHCYSIKTIDYQGYLFVHHKGSQGCSYKYVASPDFIMLADNLYYNILLHFGLVDDSHAASYRQALSNKAAFRLGLFIMKGYHKDTALRYKERMRNWTWVRKAHLLCNPSKKCTVRRFNVILNICKYRLYYLLDPFILLSVRCKDFKNENT